MPREQLIVVTRLADSSRLRSEEQARGEGTFLEGTGHAELDEDDASDPDERVECGTCHKLLKLTSLRQHARTHAGRRPFACGRCGARFTRKGDVERHVRVVHEKQRPHKCRRCPRAFADQKNLRWHVAHHDRSPSYVCPVCRFKFGKREYWENHVRFIHPAPAGEGPAAGDESVGEHLEELFAMNVLDSEAALSGQDVLPSDVLVQLSSMLGSHEGETTERPSRGAVVQDVHGRATNIAVVNMTTL